MKTILKNSSATTVKVVWVDVKDDRFALIGEAETCEHIDCAFARIIDMSMTVAVARAYGGVIFAI